MDLTFLVSISRRPGMGIFDFSRFEVEEFAMQITIRAATLFFSWVLSSLSVKFRPPASKAYSVL